MTQQFKKFEMPSGATLVVTTAPFADAWALMRATLKTLKGTEVRAEDLKRDVGRLLESSSAFSSLVDRVVEFATSPEVEAAMWRCAQRALYIPLGSDIAFPGSKVEPGLFDDPVNGISAREDYARIVTGIMEVNCLPFLAKALSGSPSPKEKSSGDQPSRLS